MREEKKEVIPVGWTKKFPFIPRIAVDCLVMAEVTYRSVDQRGAAILCHAKGRRLTEGRVEQ